jgi:hypothetical protein
MIKDDKSLNQLKKILEKLDDAINHIDGAYTQNYHYDSEVARVGNLILESRNRLQQFINLIEEQRDE